MGIDYNVVGGYKTNQTSLDHEGLNWLQVMFVQKIGRALDTEVYEFFDACDSSVGDAEVFFYAPFARSDDEIIETPYGRPPPRIDLDAFMEVTEGTDDLRLVGLRAMVDAYQKRSRLVMGEFALYLFLT